MELTIHLPDYDPKRGIQFVWQSGSNIKTSIDDRVIIIAANQEGLMSLANHLLTLAQGPVLSGMHIHLDESNGLEDGSVEMIITKE